MRRISAGMVLAGVALLSVAHADRAYVSNEDGHTVTVFDTATARVLATIDVGKRPRGMKLNRDGSRLYVAVSGLPKCPPHVPDEECAKLERDLSADGIAVVDTAAHRLLDLIPAGSDPEQFDLSADGRLLFVANEDISMTSVVDIGSRTVKQRVPVGEEPEGVVTAPNGDGVLITNESSQSVSVIDAQALKVVGTISVGQRPRGIAFTPDSGTAYVTGEADGSIYRMDVPKGQSVERALQLRKEARPMSVVLDEQRKRMYVSTGRGGTVAVIDLVGEKPDLKLAGEVQVGQRPWGIALSQDGRWLYTANGPSNDVSVVDTQALREVRKIGVGRSPWGVILGPKPPRPKTTSGEEAGASLPQAAGLVRLGFQLPVLLHHLLRLVGVAEDRAPFAGHPRALHVSLRLDEVIVAHAPRDLVDRAGALIQVRDLPARRHAVVDVFDSCLRRIVVCDRFALLRWVGGRAGRAPRQERAHPHQAHEAVESGIGSSMAQALHRHRWVSQLGSEPTCMPRASSLESRNFLLATVTGGLI
jgi:YVTN family beta-propeller protein